MVITVEKASEITGMDVRIIRRGMASGRLPFGLYLPSETKNGHDAFFPIEERVRAWNDAQDIKNGGTKE